VEFSKEALTGDDGPAKDETKATVVWAIDQCLAMLHPIMPFITEELWAQTGGTGVLMHADWPSYTSADLSDDGVEAEMRWTISLIEAIRSARAEMNVPAGAKVEMMLTDFEHEAAQRLLRQGALIRRMARLSEVAVGNEAPAGSIVTSVEGAVVNMPVADLIDVKAEGARLKKKLDKLGKEIGGLEKKLGNPGFLNKAAPEVVEEQRARLAAAQEDRTRLAAAVERLEAMG
jgi:valyl-tRNA synthetase